MIYAASRDDEKPEPYPKYKNRTVSKFENRAKELLSGIKSSSLKGGDKNDLIAKIRQEFF